MTDEQVQQTAKMLAQFKPGFLPYPVFEQIARLVALPIIEFIPLRVKDEKVEVLLIERGADDPYWPGMLHTPGTVILATDLNKDSHENWPAFQRILSDELHDTEVTKPHYVGSLFHASKRGTEQAQLYWVEVLGKPKVGKFYPIDDLPKNHIDNQQVFIKEAARHFKRYKDTKVN